jgi:predicted MPP superfamily phosphohydrolase
MKNESNQHWDIIGDIHGELEGLRLLLEKLGYEAEGGSFHHPEGRKLIFVGDLIDRGPESRGVLHLVRRLVDSGQALVVMGNHEYYMCDLIDFNNFNELIK